MASWRWQRCPSCWEGVDLKLDRVLGDELLLVLASPGGQRSEGDILSGGLDNELGVAVGLDWHADAKHIVPRWAAIPEAEEAGAATEAAAPEAAALEAAAKAAVGAVVAGHQDREEGAGYWFEFRSGSIPRENPSPLLCWFGGPPGIKQTNKGTNKRSSPAALLSCCTGVLKGSD